MKKHFYHIVARSNYGLVPFISRDHCIWVWNELSRHYAGLSAAVLMPNHLHLIVNASNIQNELKNLQSILTRFNRIFYPDQLLWEPIPTPELIPDRFHLQRQIRYVHLNPCRKKLINDPLKWEFSTHRDWLGLSYPPLVGKEIITTIFPTYSRTKFHSYVSSDPSCAVEGTALPPSIEHNKESQVRLAETPLSLILKSVLISQHAPKLDLSKRGPVRTIALHLASEAKDLYPTLLAREMGLAKQTVYNALKKQRNQDAITSAKRVLSDSRLYNMPIE